MTSASDHSFLARPGEALDWRLAVLFDAAAEAGIPAGLPASGAELAQALGLDAHSVRVVLDALVAWDVVERLPGGEYRPGAGFPSPETAATLRHHARAVRAWSTSVGDRLRGVTAEQDQGRPFDPGVFLDALAVNARRAAPAIVDLCLARFPDARRVLDLGGGHGEYSLEFARRGRHATMQDLPAMVDVVRSRGRLAQAGVATFAGSFFEVTPDGPFDLVFCAGITHTFDGEHNAALYRRLRPIIASGGGVAVVTFLRNRNPFADIFAVQMLANGSGGDSHGEEEYRRWLEAAGFAADEVVDLDGRGQSVLFASPSTGQGAGT